MKFQYLETVHKEWSDILVIGKTIERDNVKYHIVGMTLAEEARLYIIEPYSEPKYYTDRKRGVRNQRKILKEHKGDESGKNSYLHCSDFYLGNRHLQVRGGMGSPLGHSMENYEEIQLFFDMLHAGWNIPEWLKNEEWANLQLVTLNIADLERLPGYSSDMPITIKHRPYFMGYILEKTVNLTVGKSRSLRFVDRYGDEVQCHINDVTLIDVWKNAEEQFRDPRLSERLSEEQIQEMKKQHFEMFQQNCPKGMCYIGIEYECSKELGLQFYSKEYLKSFPETHNGSAIFSVMRLKPDKETGTHNLPLRGCAIQTPVASDTTKIPAELFLYLEKLPEWEETVL